MYIENIIFLGFIVALAIMSPLLFVLLMIFMKRYSDVSQDYFKLQHDVLKMSGIESPIRIRITAEVIEEEPDED